MDPKVIQWALNNGYETSAFTTTAGKNEVLEAYKASTGTGRRKRPQTATVEVRLPGSDAWETLGSMDNRKKTIQAGVLAFLVANGHGIDRQDLLDTKIRATVVVEKVDTFSTLPE